MRFYTAIDKTLNLKLLLILFKIEKKISTMLCVIGFVNYTYWHLPKLKMKKNQLTTIANYNIQLPISRKLHNSSCTFLSCLWLHWNWFVC